MYFFFISKSHILTDETCTSVRGMQLFKSQVLGKSQWKMIENGQSAPYNIQHLNALTEDIQQGTRGSCSGSLPLHKVWSLHKQHYPPLGACSKSIAQASLQTS